MRLRLLSLLVYASLGAFGVALVAAPLVQSARTVVRPYTYAPDVVFPWAWVALAAALFVVLADLARRLIAGRRAGLVRYLALVLLTLAAFGARRTLVAPARPVPVDALGHLVARVEHAADAFFHEGGRYPDHAGRLEAELPGNLRDLGYFSRGARRLRSRVVVVPDQWAPLLRPPPGAGPGDLAFAVAPDRKRFWLTAFVLDRRGRLVPLADSRGRAVVARAQDGRVSSRLDPHFPEYPRKSHGAPAKPTGSAAGAPGGP